jgi:hypothetical protein
MERMRILLLLRKKRNKCETNQLRTFICLRVLLYVLHLSIFYRLVQCLTMTPLWLVLAM